MNIVSAELKANPFSFLAALRSSEPVYRTTLPDRVKTPVWLVTRYEDVNALLKDERFPRNRRSALTPEQIRKLPWVPPMFRPLERNMLGLDQPDHTRLRALVHKAFTPRLVERIRERVQTLADELLEGVARRGKMDLINDYALPLPMTIITEILGVPTGDQHKFHKWSKAVVALSSPNPTVRVIPAIWMFIRYLRRFEPSLIKSAVEELLRYTAPVFMSTERYAREDVTLHGITIPRGEMTLGVIGSANRDEIMLTANRFGAYY